MTDPHKKSLSKPRKRATPVWRRSWFRMAAVSVFLVMLGASGWWTLRTGLLSQMIEQAKWHAIASSAHIGLRIDEVLVVGRRHTGRDDLLAALGTTRGAPILAFDVNLAKERVEKLPWVRRASVERMFPDTVLLTVEERAPLALWQHEGTFALIDYEGEVILRDKLDDYRNLMIVVGADAPVHTATLMETLGSQPELLSLVRAAIRVGGRRWNLRLNGGVDVRLPEEGASTAWLRLAQYQRSHGVLERDVKIVDLRLPDRLIVRKSPVFEGVELGVGQET
jgi:cell division protein FtsQ